MIDIVCRLKRVCSVHKTIVAIAAAGLLLVASGTVVKADDGFKTSDPVVLGAGPQTANDLWFGIYLSTSRIGGTHITSKLDQYEGKDALLEQSETSTTLVAFGTPIEQHVTANMWTDPTGTTPYYETVSIGSGGMTSEVTVKFYSDHIDAVLVSGQTKTRKTINMPDNTRVTANDFAQGIWSNTPLRLNQSFRQATFNPVTLKLDVYTIKVVATNLSISDSLLGTVDGLNQCSVSGPDGDLNVYQDQQGLPVRIDMPAGLVMRRDYSHAADPVPGTFGAARFTGAMYVPPVDFATASAVSQEGASIDRPRDVRKLKLILTLPDTGPKTMTIISVPPKATKTTVKSLAANKSLAPYLTDEAYLGLGSDAVKKRAALLKGKEESAYAIVVRTRNWVHLKMHPTANFGLPRSASSILRDMRGVCRDYAIVYAALARAQGVPTRLCSGIVAFRDKFYYHAWAESYVGGTVGWLPVDPTMEMGTVDATHVAINRGDPASIYDLVGVIGRVQAKVLETTY